MGTSTRAGILPQGLSPAERRSPSMPSRMRQARGPARPARCEPPAGPPVRRTPHSGGPNDPAYRAGPVAEAVDGSGPVGDDDERTFTTDGLRTELPEPGGHLLGLLDAVTGPDEETDLPADVERACERPARPARGRRPCPA
ncbi:hypothetical protein ACFV0O_18000 [Kitasatospora sp. NPDC059577]|uniref:hypothetical protein n=1 Tax=unclassified Kitasatospora TaxID=2633591 RepID=UPI00369AD625